MKGLFIFRRDLRLDDNLALNKLAEQCDIIYCIFILDDRQIDPRRNKYFSYASFLFMLKSIHELQEKIHLTVLSGKSAPHKLISQLVKDLGIELVYASKDYTKFSLERYSDIKKLTPCYEELMNHYLNEPT